jgi:hypothetical protein|tara:strand:- start:154 stop:294 length:141 start_codon:yes stop_codon:yes gene_type:complete
MLREEASPAKVLELNTVAKVSDLDKPSKSGSSSELYLKELKGQQKD